MNTKKQDFNPNLIGMAWGDGMGGGRGVKALILAFFSIQLLFIRDIHAKFDIPNLHRSIDTG